MHALRVREMCPQVRECGWPAELGTPERTLGRPQQGCRAAEQACLAQRVPAPVSVSVAQHSAGARRDDETRRAPLVDDEHFDGIGGIGRCNDRRRAAGETRDEPTHERDSAYKTTGHGVTIALFQ